jgi:hypothetical protein
MLSKSFNIQKPALWSFDYDEELFREALNDWNEKRSTWLKKMIEEDTKDGRPLRELSTAAIKRQLEFNGLDSANGNRETLIGRLELYLEGVEVQTRQMKRKTFSDLSVSELSHKRTKVELVKRAENKHKVDILCVPHKVIEDFVFGSFYKHRNMSWEDLISCSQTCVYLREDAVNALRRDALRFFGQGSSEMTIHLFYKLKKFWFSETLRGFQKKVHNLLSLSYAVVEQICRSFYLNDAFNKVIIFNMMTRFIKEAQRQYGSVNGVKDEYIRRRSLVKAKENEKNHLLKGAPDRVRDLNNFFVSVNYPESMFSFNNKSQTLTHGCTMSIFLDEMKLLQRKKCEQYVLKAKYLKLLPKIVFRLGDTEKKVYGCICEQLEALDYYGKRDKNQRFMYFLDENIYQFSRIIMQCALARSFFKTPFTEDDFFTSLRKLMRSINFLSHGFHVLIYTTPSIKEEPFYYFCAEMFPDLRSLTMNLLSNTDIPLKSHRKLEFINPATMNYIPDYQKIVFAKYW